MVRSTTVDVPTPDGVADCLLVVPDDGGPHPAVLLHMDAFGPRPRLEEMAATLAEQGYVVLVPNAFYRHGRTPLVAGRPDRPRRPRAAACPLRDDLALDAGAHARAARP